MTNAHRRQHDAQVVSRAKFVLGKLVVEAKYLQNSVIEIGIVREVADVATLTLADPRGGRPYPRDSTV